MLFVVYVTLFLIVFAFGCCIGSFLNVVVYRVPRGLSAASGRSCCPDCRSFIRARDLIPLVSWFRLHGRCRDCGAKISRRYPLLEVAGGLLALLVFVRYGYSLRALTVFSAAAILVAVTMIDFDTMTIPDGLILALLAPAALSFFTFPETAWPSRLLGLVLLSVPMAVLAALIPDSFGGGDIKLIAVCGLMLGWQETLLAGFLALLTGGAYAVWLLAGKRAARGEHMAFGPFLCLGTFAAQMWGGALIHAYLALFGLA